MSSKAWKNGSTRKWKNLRRRILDRDGWICQACGQLIDPQLKPPHQDSGAVHHTMGRAITGDNPRYLVATHMHCNRAIGEPKQDPQPRPATKW